MPWQRFTLLDGLMLQAGCAAGCALAGALFWDPRGELSTTAVLLWLVVGTGAGLLLSGPLVLGVQWSVRRRRTPLTYGEVCWLVPLLLGALAFAGALATLWQVRSALAVGLVAMAVAPPLIFPCTYPINPAEWRRWIGRQAGWSSVFGAAVIAGIATFEWAAIAVAWLWWA